MSRIVLSAILAILCSCSAPQRSVRSPSLDGALRDQAACEAVQAKRATSDVCPVLP